MNRNLRSIFYISDSCLDRSEAAKEVARLVLAAQQKNERLGITGALVFTGDNFAQVIEGPSKSIESLVGALMVDPRHRNMTIHTDLLVSSRRFGNWALAYCGPSVYVSKHIKGITGSDGTPQNHRISRFLRLLEGLSQPNNQSAAV